MHIYTKHHHGEYVYLLSMDGEKLTIHLGTIVEITATLPAEPNEEPKIRYAVETSDGQRTRVWESEDCIVSVSATYYNLAGAIRSKIGPKDDPS